jgi:uncharacterized cofD-like protein
MDKRQWPMVNRYNRSMRNKSLNVVAIGGGNGAVQVLLGLKTRPNTELTGIIAVTDTGRSTGKVRTLANIPAPGDIRNAIGTLAGDSFMAELIQHRLRVPNYDVLDGVAFGNLMLAAITQMTGSFGKAIELMANALNIPATILPVTTHDTHICAELVDGSIVEQEVNVRGLNKPAIKRVFVQHPAAEVYPPCLDAIAAADLITIGPGSLFTTTIACLAFEGIRAAIKRCKAKVVFVCNNTTQPGQTDGFTLFEHVRQINEYLDGRLDVVLLNSRKPTPHARRLYAADGVQVLLPTPSEVAQIRKLGVKVLVRDVAEETKEKRSLWQKQTGIDGSISRAHARMPPLTFLTFLRPTSFSRKLTTSALRTPLRQCTNISS